MRSTKRMMIALVVVLALVAAACGAAADKISEEAAQQIAEKAIEQSGGGDVDVDVSGEGDDATVKVETEDGSMSFGSGSEMPEGLEIPVPDGGTVQAAFSGSDGIMASLYYDQGRYDEIIAFYEDWTANTGDEWQKQSFDMTGDDGTIRNTMWIKDTDEANMAITVGDCPAMGSDDTDANAVCVSVNQG